jgi:hypothetical protein
VFRISDVEPDGSDEAGRQRRPRSLELAHFPIAHGTGVGHIAVMREQRKHGATDAARCTG